MTSTSSSFERRIALAGATNFRDLGGYETAEGRTVRWRRVFRADALHDLTPDDVETLTGWGLRDVFDLRSTRELELFGATPLTEHGVRHHHVPMVADLGARTGMAARLVGPDDHQAHADSYLALLEHARPAVQQVFDALCDGSEGGAVFHCTGGRDRTGLMAALLLSVLGVPRPVIADDYALTTQYLSFPEERIARLRAIYGDRLQTDRIPPTYGDVITLTLAGLDERYGSPEGYLSEAGVTDAQQDELRASLLEGA